MHPIWNSWCTWIAHDKQTDSKIHVCNAEAKLIHSTLLIADLSLRWLPQACLHSCGQKHSMCSTPYVTQRILLDICTKLFPWTLQTDITCHTTLAHQEDSRRLCNYIDGSDSHWSRAITHVPCSQWTLPRSNQARESCPFPTRIYSDIKRTWSILKKGWFAALAPVHASHQTISLASRMSWYFWAIHWPQ